MVILMIDFYMVRWKFKQRLNIYAQYEIIVWTIKLSWTSNDLTQENVLCCDALAFKADFFLFGFK